MGNFAISGFAAAILEFRMVIDIPGLCHLIAQTYLGKATEGFQSTPCGSEMAAKRSVWEVLLPPPNYHMRVKHKFILLLEKKMERVPAQSHRVVKICLFVWCLTACQHRIYRLICANCGDRKSVV